MNTLWSAGLRQALPMMLLASLMILSCKKDAEDNLISAKAPQRLAEIVTQKGGINNFKDICLYEDHRISSYCRYGWTTDGEWKDWVRVLFEYPGEDMIIEVMEGVSDSNWFPAIKWEKHFLNGKISEIIEAHWTSNDAGRWNPVFKLCWIYEGERLIMRLKYNYENAAWEERWKMNYHYIGSLWNGATCMERNDGSWDTIKCMYMGYSDGNLREVNIYDHDCDSGWNFGEQYLFEYHGKHLMKMSINEAYGDSIRLDMTLNIAYNEYGNPVSYTEVYECCPTQSTFLTYDPQDGNDQLPFHNEFAWDQYPWVPSPVLKEGSGIIFSFP